MRPEFIPTVGGLYINAHLIRFIFKDENNKWKVQILGERGLVDTYEVSAETAMGLLVK